MGSTLAAESDNHSILHRVGGMAIIAAAIGLAAINTVAIVTRIRADDVSVSSSLTIPEVPNDHNGSY